VFCLGDITGFGKSRGIERRVFQQMLRKHDEGNFHHADKQKKESRRDKSELNRRHAPAQAIVPSLNTK